MLSQTQVDNFSEAQISELEEFVNAVSQGIASADFGTKRRVIELLGVRGKLSIEI